MGIALSCASIGTWIMGYLDQARSYCQSSLKFAQDKAHPMVSWFAYYYAGHFYIYAHEIQEVKFFIDEALRICDEQDLAYYRVYSQALQGWYLANTGDETGITLLEQGANRLRQTGDRLNLLLLLRLFADASLKIGLVTQALNLVDEALELSHETQIIYDKPELMRIKGEILISLYPHEPQIAEAWFVRAVESAVQQKSKIWELRAAVSLARMWRKQDKRKEAQQALLEIYGWFSEGFGTADLKEARSLLSELS
jgi:predicted ATPase